MSNDIQNQYHNKILYLVIEISQLLAKHKTTYKEVEEIINCLSNHYKHCKECLQYPTAKDFFTKNKVCNTDNKLIDALNHIYH